MTRSLRTVPLSFAAVLLAVALVPAGSAGRESSSDIQGSGEDRHALDGLSPRDLEGETWTDERLRGRVVLLDFWASWCAPCLAAIPDLQQLQRLTGDGRFVLLGVALDTGPRRDLVRFVRTREMGWPQLWDGRGFSGKLARRFEVEALPRTVLLDREGRIVAVDLRGPALEAAVRTVLGEPEEDDEERSEEGP